MAKRENARGKILPIGNGLRTLGKLQGDAAPKYDFRLYIAGTNLNSVRAIENVRRLCKQLRPSRCDLDIIDLYQQPGLARRDEVVAAPALIKIFPLPRRTFIGDLSDTARVIAGLGIVTAIKDGRSKSAGQ
jgi:circadian clock protein KaiB